jgi:hypothetical protein
MRGKVVWQAIVRAFDDRNKLVEVSLWRCVRRREKRSAYALDAIGDFRNRLTGNDEAVICEDENVRVVRKPFCNRMGERQARLTVGHEGERDIRMGPQAFAGERLAVVSDGERNCVHAMDMDDDWCREDRVHCGLDRRPQAAGVQLRVHEVDRRRGAGIFIGNGFAQRV